MKTEDQSGCMEAKANLVHSKCPKLSKNKVSEKMTYANSADPDQTAPEAV